MYHPFSVIETIKAAWHVVKKNYVTLIIYSIISLALYKIISFSTSLIYFTDSTYNKIIIVLIMMIVQSYLTLSFYKLILTLIYREYYEFEFKDIVPTIKMVLNFVVIALCLVVLIGTVIFINLRLHNHDSIIWVLDKLEIMALIYLLIRSMFCICFIVDDDSGPFESLKQSFNATKGNFFRLIGLILMVLLFIALLLFVLNEFITLFVSEDSKSADYIFEIAGLIWFAISFPTVQVMIMTTYKKLVYSHLDVDDDIAETN
ncbi:hypothetical protein A0256_18320 [Mucilaginibacter sp. PAMC 26640]|nr:hypothetical protein A0256_18320 [Mucilaginibacter sp. PAMC 26640]